MTDPEPLSFRGFPDDAVSFLRELEVNNDRGWFDERKAVYERALKKPAKAFSLAMASALQDLTGIGHGHKIFRIHRDIRFSKDKTPYNTHLRIAFLPESGGMPESGGSSSPSWFFSLETDRLTLGTGNFAFSSSALDHFRERLLGEDGKELASIMQTFEGKGLRLGEPDLKRVPNVCPKDHPLSDLFRHKGLSAWIDRDDPTMATDPGFVPACIADFTVLKPLFDWLRG